MTTGGDVACFTAVDRTSDPNFFVRFLDEANALPCIRASKAILVEELHLRGGEVVLDAGCGTGADVLAVAQRVGSHGRAVGVDLSEVLIAEAKARSAGSPLPVDYEVGDAQALRFDDGVFDACRAERVLMHVPDADRALGEMVRVTRTGGRLAVFELDFDTLVVDSPHREVTRVILRSVGDGIRHGWIGRQLPRMFKQSGLTDVTVTPHTVFFPCEFLELLAAGALTVLRETGVLGAEGVLRWREGVREAQQAGTFRAAITAFIVAGTKA